MNKEGKKGEKNNFAFVRNCKYANKKAAATGLHAVIEMV